MSLTNMICAGIVGEWPYYYVIRTPILQEAERHDGALFDGAIGRLKQEGDDSLFSSAVSDINQWGFTAAYLSIEDAESTSKETRSLNDVQILLARVGKNVKRFKFSPRGSRPYNSVLYTFGISSMAYDGLPDSAGMTQSDWSTMILILLLLPITIVLPYVVILVLTDFRKWE
ncbi:hypothetical protein AcW1_004625 [Taiwanofungus camphoratus]|nr:hypothetical protein AcW2_006372 [Antrodia cinnamomea]KAI0939671.1 hypothetical protein AcV5_001010 [Antrodia cinnamomea]KAI0952586.1 hypothetical protein AcV7_008338 [Antrodia cinnamomea]KAI0959958.1 hypothetical protein AcW1_004625 [Antrodia cinnamomea]